MKSGADAPNFMATIACEGDTVPFNKSHFQPSPSDSIGPTRSCVSFFTNPFRKLVFPNCKAESRYFAHS